MTTQELEGLVGQAGFKPVAIDSPLRTIFTRGESTLILWAGGKWGCYASVCGGKRPDCGGDDFKSLLLFLMSEFYLSSGN
jgi:hypothetical protein